MAFIYSINRIHVHCSTSGAGDRALSKGTIPLSPQSLQSTGGRAGRHGETKYAVSQVTESVSETKQAEGTGSEGCGREVLPVG